MEIGNGKTGVSRNQSWHLVRIALANLLLTASALKCWQLATEPIIGTSLLDSRWLLMVTVELELLFGLWLLANIWAKPTWAAALACFGLFTCVSLCKALSGHASCGCFGRVQVSPWYTGALDLAVMASLLRWRPKESCFTIQRATAVLVIWLLIGIPAAYAMGSYTTIILSDAGAIASDGKTVVLEPEQWSGKRFPLLPYMENHPGYSQVNEHPLQERLADGKWLVLLYHYDCPKCQEVLRGLQRIARDLNIQQVALIEMPPYGKDSNKSNLAGITLLQARLVSTREWFVESPFGLLLSKGVIVDFRNKSDLLKSM